MFSLMLMNLSTFSSTQKQPPGMFYERRFLTDFAKFTRQQLCQGLLLKIREQLFPSEFSEIFQSTFFAEQLRVTASVNMHQINLLFLVITWKMLLPAGYLVKKNYRKSHPEIFSKAVDHRYSLKKALCDISQSSQEIVSVGLSV